MRNINDAGRMDLCAVLKLFISRDVPPDNVRTVSTIWLDVPAMKLFHVYPSPPFIKENGPNASLLGTAPRVGEPKAQDFVTDGSPTGCALFDLWMLRFEKRSFDLWTVNA